MGNNSGKAKGSKDFGKGDKLASTDVVASLEDLMPTQVRRLPNVSICVHRKFGFAECMESLTCIFPPVFCIYGVGHCGLGLSKASCFVFGRADGE